jgi:hypothetical protein
MSRALHILSIPSATTAAAIVDIISTWGHRYEKEFGPLIVLPNSMHLVRLDGEHLTVCKSIDELIELVKERKEQECAELADTSQESPVQTG